MLEKFYRDTNRTNSVGRLEQWLLTDDIPTDTQGQHINLLAKQIRQRRDVLLSSLGRDSETEWLASRLVKPQAIDFWTRYLRRLQERGITTFTNEQAGEKITLNGSGAPTIFLLFYRLDLEKRLLVNCAPL